MSSGYSIIGKERGSGGVYCFGGGGGLFYLLKKISKIRAGSNRPLQKLDILNQHSLCMPNIKKNMLLSSTFFLFLFLGLDLSGNLTHLAYIGIISFCLFVKQSLCYSRLFLCLFFFFFLFSVFFY